MKFLCSFILLSSDIVGALVVRTDFDEDMIEALVDDGSDGALVDDDSPPKFQRASSSPGRMTTKAAQPVHLDRSSSPDNYLLPDPREKLGSISEETRNFQDDEDDGGANFNAIFNDEPAAETTSDSDCKFKKAGDHKYNSNMKKQKRGKKDCKRDSGCFWEPGTGGGSCANK